MRFAEVRDEACNGAGASPAVEDEDGPASSLFADIHTRKHESTC